MARLEHAIDLLIYLSVALGVVLLPQIYSLVPPWLFYAVFGGWIAYLIVALAARFHHKAAYPAAFLLAVVTLLSSLPDPTHYSFAGAGMWLATATFVTGSVLQICLLVLISVHFLKLRKGNR